MSIFLIFTYVGNPNSLSFIMRLASVYFTIEVDDELDYLCYKIIRKIVFKL